MIYDRPTVIHASLHLSPTETAQDRPEMGTTFVVTIGDLESIPNERITTEPRS